MTDPIKKKVDESWKEQAEREKHVGTGGTGSTDATPSGPPADLSERARPVPGSGAGALTPDDQPGDQPQGARDQEGEDAPAGSQARFDMFVSGLVIEGFVALGDMPHPTTRRQAINLTQAKYLIDLLGVLAEKTKGNLSIDEQRLLDDSLYQLRMRYLNKAGGS